MSFINSFVMAVLVALPMGIAQLYAEQYPWIIKAVIGVYGYFCIGFFVDVAKFPGGKAGPLQRLYLASIWPLRLLGL